jgi:uncharacterized membrane protein YfcA
VGIEFSLDIVLLLLAALCAGFVDAVAGGGGLIQVPALLAAFPTHPPATLFGTNKIASVVGTLTATWRYARRIPITWSIALPMAGAAALASFFGAAAVSWLPRELARPLIIGLLAAVFLYTLKNHHLGTTPHAQVRQRSLVFTLMVGALLGFYDGFFGPGMGSFLIFAGVRLFDLDFLRASACAKLVNACTNLAALAWFAPTGHLMLTLGLMMALANVLGAQIGARQAIARGARFVRHVFLFSTIALLAKLILDVSLAQ